MGVLRGVGGGQDGVVTLGQALRAGLTLPEVRRLCRAGRWRALARGCYLVDADGYGDVPRRAQIRATVQSFGPYASAVLDTAGELHGIAGLRRTEMIHVSVPGSLSRRKRHTHPQVVVHQLLVPPQALCTVNGIRATDVLHTVADVILRTERYSAVCVLDSALNQGLLTSSQFAAIPALIHGRRGARSARAHIEEADGRAESPLETRVRLRCTDGNVAPDSLQHVVRDQAGRVLGIGDMAWLRFMLLAEADGRGPHSTPEAVYADRRRQNRLVAAGWTLARFTWQDTLHPDYIPHVIRSLLTRGPA